MGTNPLLMEESRSAAVTLEARHNCVKALGHRLCPRELKSDDEQLWLNKRTEFLRKNLLAKNPDAELEVRWFHGEFSHGDNDVFMWYECPSPDCPFAKREIAVEAKEHHDSSCPGVLIKRKPEAAEFQEKIEPST